MSWIQIGANRWVSGAQMFATGAPVGERFSLGNVVLELQDYQVENCPGVYPLGSQEILFINGSYKLYNVSFDSNGPIGSKFVRETTRPH